MVEVLGTSGPNRGAYLFDLTGAGRDRAREALASSQYVGPAPVPLVQYRTWVEKQTIRNVHVTREVVREGFRRMVLSDAVHDVLGPSINSAKSLFLYGAPGNGKTMIAETISHLLGGDIFVHGSCVTIGCVPIGDDAIKELYVVAVEARAAGQARIPIHLFPTRLDAGGLAYLDRLPGADRALKEFWHGLRPGYDAFERDRVVPEVAVDAAGRYQVRGVPRPGG